MKKYLIIMCAAIAMVSCSKKENANNNRVADLEKGGVQNQGSIAYVEYDSLMTKYEYCKQYAEQLQHRSANYQQQLAQKQQALENAAVDFQRKVQSGQYTEEQAQAQQKKLQQQQEQLQRLSADLEQKFASEQAAINEALHDSVQNFLREFNKDGRYSMILSKAGDNILYADPKLNITDQVINGLNKRYKK